MRGITYRIKDATQVVRDTIRLFKWFSWIRIVTVGWALPFEFIGILVSIAIYYFYTIGLTGGKALLEGFDPVHYLITGMFVRSLVNIPLPSVYNSVNDLYEGFFGSGGARMSLADYLMNFKMSIYSYILANLLSIYIRESIIALLYLLVGLTFYGLALPPLGDLLIVAAALSMGSLASLGMGFMVSSIVWLTGVRLLKNPIIWFLDIFITLASGTYFPVELLPPLLRYASFLLPHLYCIRVIRSTFNPGMIEPFPSDLAILLVYALALVLIGPYVFHVSYRKWGKRGPPTPI